MRVNILGIIGIAVGIFFGFLVLLPLLAPVAELLVARAAAGNNPELNVIAIKLTYLLVSLGLPATVGYGIGASIMGR